MNIEITKPTEDAISEHIEDKTSHGGPYAEVDHTHPDIDFDRLQNYISQLDVVASDTAAGHTYTITELNILHQDPTNNSVLSAIDQVDIGSIIDLSEESSIKFDANTAVELVDSAYSTAGGTAVGDLTSNIPDDYTQDPHPQFVTYAELEEEISSNLSTDVLCCDGIYIHCPNTDYVIYSNEYDDSEEPTLTTALEKIIELYGATDVDRNRYAQISSDPDSPVGKALSGTKEDEIIEKLNNLADDVDDLVNTAMDLYTILDRLSSEIINCTNIRDKLDELANMSPDVSPLYETVSCSYYIESPFDNDLRLLSTDVVREKFGNTITFTPSSSILSSNGLYAIPNSVEIKLEPGGNTEYRIEIYRNRYHLSFYAGEGIDCPQSQDVKYDDYVYSHIGTSPTKPGYVFVGWSDNGSMPIDDIMTYHMPANDLTLTAIWNQE